MRRVPAGIGTVQWVQLIAVRPIDGRVGQAGNARRVADGPGGMFTTRWKLAAAQQCGNRRSLRWPAHLVVDVLCNDLETHSTPVPSNRAGTAFNP